MMNSQNVHMVAVQAQLGMVMRELMRLSRESNQPLSTITVTVDVQGFVEVTEVLTGGFEVGGYSL